MPFSGGTPIGTAANATGGTLVLTIGAAVPAGNLIIVAVTEKSTTGVNGSLADSNGNTWNLSQAGNLAATAADGRGMVWFAFASKALAASSTITYTRNTSAVNAAMSVWSYTGIVTGANPEDTAARGTANGTTGTITVTSGTPSRAGQLFVGVLCDSGTTTAGGNATFTQASGGWLISNGFEARIAGAANARVDAGGLLAGSGTQTYAPRLSSTAQQWILFITAFQTVPDPTNNLPIRRGVPPDEAAIWTGHPIDSAPIQLLSAQRIFGGGGQVVAHNYEDDPTFQTDLWLGHPVGVATTLNPPPPPAATIVPRSPFYVPRFDRYESNWQGAPDPAIPLPLLPPPILTSTVQSRPPFYSPNPGPIPDWLGIPSTSPTLRMLSVGGKPFAKQWRYDYQIEAPLWLGQPTATEISSFPVVQPFSKLNRVDVITDTDWIGRAIKAATLQLQETQSPTKFWRYDFSPEAEWLGRSARSEIIRLLSEGGQPPTKSWRYDYDQTTFWQGGPDPAIPLPLLAPVAHMPGAAVSVPEYVEPPSWLGQPVATRISTFPVAAQLYAVGAVMELGEPYETPWLGTPLARPAALTPAPPPSTVQSRSPLYSPKPPLIPDWLGQPLPASAMSIPSVQLYAATGLWETWDPQFETQWVGKPVGSSISTLPSGVIILPPPPFYAPRPPELIVSPQPLPPNLQFLKPPVLAPFAKLWRYDLITDTLWTWQAPPSLTPRMPPPAPFFKLWRSDLITDTAWTWQAPGSQSLRIPPIPTRPKAWRYDLITDTEWVGRSARAATLQLGRPIRPPQWTDLYQPEPVWTWVAPASLTPRLPVPSTVQSPTKFWRYDYDMVGSFWTWAIPISLTLYIPPPPPPGLLSVSPMIGSYPKWRKLS